MNKLIISFRVFLLVVIFSFVQFQSAQAVVAIQKVDHSELASEKKLKNSLTKKQIRKQNRVEKRLKKFQQKWERKNKKKKRFFGGVTDEPKFRLGLILWLAGLIVVFLDFLPFLGRLLNFVGGLSMLIGVVLMIWALAEYFDWI